jgi:hypothetical protein
MMRQKHGRNQDSQDLVLPGANRPLDGDRAGPAAILERLLKSIGELLRATVPAGFQIATTPVPLSEVDRAWPGDDSTRRTVFTN